MSHQSNMNSSFSEEVSYCSSNNTNYATAELKQMLMQTELLTKQTLQKLESANPLHDVGHEGCSVLQHQREQFEENYQYFQQTIRELRVVDAEEREELQALRTALQGPAVTGLKHAIDELLRQKSEVEREAAVARESEPTQRQLLEVVTQRCKQLSGTCPGLLRKTKTKMDLYSGIARIKWDYGAPEGQVSGFVARPDRREVIPFTLDQSSNSQFFITNFLWDQLALDTREFE